MFWTLTPLKKDNYMEVYSFVRYWWNYVLLISVNSSYSLAGTTGSGK